MGNAVRLGACFSGGGDLLFCYACVRRKKSGGSLPSILLSGGTSLEEAYRQICPWCDTEIVWDPEIGPEKECPHCLNELGDYRSVSLSAGRDESEQAPSKRANSPTAEEAEDIADLDELDELDDPSVYDYEEAVRRLQEEQEEGPECVNCREFMLYAGEQAVPPTAAFRPSVPASIRVPLLKTGYSFRVFVCPSCFRLDYMLSEHDRLALVNRISGNRNGEG
jgi:hypothetical protein